jgi:4-amino-4-deoxychorismate lyase
MTAWVNGRRSLLIDARDRGLQYGDGLFETMRVRGRTVRLLDLHLERLLEGCRRLQIEPPAAERLRREITRAAAQRATGVLKLIVTRGVGPRGYRPSGQERTTRILLLSPLPRRGPAGAPLTLRVCRTQLGHNERLAGLKTLNRLEQVLARTEWNDPQIREGLLCDGDGHPVCGTMSNLFLRRGRRLFTPLLDRCGVAGVMRRWVIAAAPALGYRVTVRRLRIAELAGAEEVFMTNAVAGPMSVGEIRLGARRLRPASTQAAVRLRVALDAP